MPQWKISVKTVADTYHTFYYEIRGEERLNLCVNLNLQRWSLRYNRPSFEGGFPIRKLRVIRIQINIVYGYLQVEWKIMCYASQEFH